VHRFGAQAGEIDRAYRDVTNMLMLKMDEQSWSGTGLRDAADISGYAGRYSINGAVTDASGRADRAGNSTARMITSSLRRRHDSPIHDRILALPTGTRRARLYSDRQRCQYILVFRRIRADLDRIAEHHGEVENRKLLRYRPHRHNDTGERLDAPCARLRRGYLAVL
jgi:hypothetical protein